MVTVVMTTYNPEPSAPRFGYAAEALQSLRENLRSLEKIEYLVTDDGSPMQPHQLSDLRYRASYVTGPHNGIGASLNRALMEIKDWPVLYTVDDWVLTEPLDLTLPLWLLENDYSYVRLGP